jgi:hypothetical protein
VLRSRPRADATGPHVIACGRRPGLRQHSRRRLLTALAACPACLSPFRRRLRRRLPDPFSQRLSPAEPADHIGRALTSGRLGRALAVGLREVGDTHAACSDPGLSFSIASASPQSPDGHASTMRAQGGGQGGGELPIVAKGDSAAPGHYS